MAVEVTRKVPEPVEPLPIEQIALGHSMSKRKVTIRPNSERTSRTSHLRTVEMTDRYGEKTKWTATLGDIRTFGQACIDMADGK